MKKVLALSLALILCLALIGCSSNNGGNNDNAASASSNAATNADDSSSANADSDTNANTASSTGLTGDFEIQYFVGGYGDAWWKEIIGEFQKANPDLNIKQSAGPKINEQMKPRWISGSPPDFIYIDGAGSNERQMIEDDQLMDITDWLKNAKNKDGEAILDVAIAKPSEYNGGKYYNLPLVFGSWGIFYDKKLFADNGWTAPTDWESFLDVSQKIKDAGISPFIHTGVYPYYIHGGLLDSAIVAANGGDPSILVKMSNLEEGIFKSEPMKKALDKLVTMRDKGFIDQGSVALNHTDSQSLWLQHKAAFIPNGLWLENEMKKDIPAGFDFGFTPSVTQDKGQNTIAIPYTNTIAVAKKAKNPDAAKAFIEFLFTKQAAVRWAELTGAIMNVKADLDASSASQVVKDAMKFFNSAQTTVAPVVVLNADVDKVKMDSTVALTQGSITPEEWMDRMEEAAKKARK